MFNETAAWEYAFSMVGKPYGYHHLIFSWIDTIDGNYPPPLDAHVKLKGVGSSFDELLTIPEQDNWIYSDGKSTSCVVFILEMYKEAGLFDPIANSIQVTKFKVVPRVLDKVGVDQETAAFDSGVHCASILLMRL
ncbi:uncharacterized protein LOC114272971 [Camellia sinensis]|uniref:uncharacterized protein LOC114272971 n=1 Tax=Camellia sinensis TaxID=4442 RepID=UPI001036D902|nr:uncharacterized protein LOC114272971 [Camellia sinensis]